MNKYTGYLDNRKPNEYTVWFALPQEVINNEEETQSEKKRHDVNIKNYIEEFYDSYVCSEGIYHARVKMSSLEKFVDLGIYFDDDITICGTDMDIIAPVGTLRELGLV